MAQVLKTVEQLIALDLGNQAIALRSAELRIEKLRAENEELNRRLVEAEAEPTAPKSED